MHVGDEHPAQLGEAQIAAEKLMLRAFAAVEQPHLRALRQTQRHGGHVACPCWNAGAGSEKGDLQGR